MKTPRIAVTAITLWFTLAGVVACAPGSTTSPGADQSSTGTDTSSPSAPTGLTGVAVATSAISLTWGAAADNVGIATYAVYRDGNLAGSSDVTRYIDRGLSAASSHIYTVRASDAAGNTSTFSGAVTVTTLALNMSSVLAETAAEMNAGEWRELATGNLEPTLAQTTCGATGSIFPFSEDAVWDPASHRVYFIGSDHIYIGNCPGMIGQRFISYSEAENNWSALPNPPWFAPTVAHGYDHSAIDVARGIYYHFPYGESDRTVHRYDITDEKWLPDTPTAPTRACCTGVEYFPEFVGADSSAPAGGLVFAGDGNVWAHRTSANQWTGALSDSRLNFGEYHTVAEYNPVHKVVIFGGGEVYSLAQAFNTLFKLAPDGTVTALNNAPFTLRVNLSIVTVDPVSGDYLVFGPNGEFYVFDVIANKWTQKTGSPLFAAPLRNGIVTTVDLTVAAPISTYGVVMFIKHIPGNAAQTKVYLYKHSG